MVIGTNEAGRHSAGVLHAQPRASLAAEPLTDEQLERLDRWVRDVIHDTGTATLLSEQCAADVARLVGEVHRLRELIALAYRSVPDREGTRSLMARLKAEVDR